MRVISYWRPALGALAVLGFALNVSAEDRPITSKTHATAPDNYGGQVLTPGPGNALVFVGDNCAELEVGKFPVLPATGGWLSGDTYMAGDNFDGSLYPAGCGYSYGPSGHDQIWPFQVETNGRWTFDTCTKPAGFDTSIGITYDIGIGCPGVGLICNGDDPCGAYWESAIRDVCLTANNNQAYWLIVDGWSPFYAFPGTYYDVTYSMTVEPCPDDDACSDGILCNGIESCIKGCCYPGPPACNHWETCYEDTQECINEQDPRTGILNSYNSLWTATQACETPGPGCEMFWKCDDIQMWWGSGVKLISYKTFYQAREYWDDCNVEGLQFPVETAIFEGMTDGSCVPDDTAMVSGTLCSFTGIVTGAGEPPQEALCEPGGGMQSGIVLPTRRGDTFNCEIDYFICMRSALVSGFQIAGEPAWAGDILGDAIADELVGGPGGSDDWEFDVMFYEGNDPVGEPVTPESACRSGVFSPSWFGGDPPADFADLHVLVEPVGECCFPDPKKGCVVEAEKDCVGNGGTYRGDIVLTKGIKPWCDPMLGDPDGDDLWYECDNCPWVYNWDQADCNNDGEGDACEPWEEQDKDGDGKGCCNAEDFCPNDPRKCADGGQCGCGEDEIDSDGDGCMDCVDECPNDPDKCIEGICGCNAAPGDRDDNDGDGVLNCVDVCPGADDAVFAPGCKGAIPTVSEWGLVILALLLLAAGKVYFGRRKATV